MRPDKETSDSISDCLAQSNNHSIELRGGGDGGESNGEMSEYNDDKRDRGEIILSAYLNVSLGVKVSRAKERPQYCLLEIYQLTEIESIKIVKLMLQQRSLQPWNNG